MEESVCESPVQPNANKNCGTYGVCEGEREGVWVGVRVGLREGLWVGVCVCCGGCKGMRRVKFSSLAIHDVLFVFGLLLTGASVPYAPTATATVINKMFQARRLLAMRCEVFIWGLAQRLSTTPQVCERFLTEQQGLTN